MRKPLTGDQITAHVWPNGVLLGSSSQDNIYV